MEGFVCTYCFRIFSTKQGCAIHKLTHEQENTFECDHCDYKSACINSITVHMQIHDQGKFEDCEKSDTKDENRILCHICGKWIANLSNLIRHLRIHTGDKPYTCKFCEKKFSDISAMKQHLRIHSLDDCVICGECGGTYISKKVLDQQRKHMHALRRICQQKNN